MRQTEIRIENARSHNLKGVSCRIPLRALTVVTGPSGSGKSTLAFDTLYAEGQRRYVGSLSTYARQFLERLPRPVVDSISNLPPAIAIEQRNTVTNARSTVGTATEILDHLRLLFSKIGVTECPDCRRVVTASSASGVAEILLGDFAGARLSLAAPVERDPGEGVEDLRARLLRDGYTRFLDADRRVVDVTEVEGESLATLATSGSLLIDRLAVPAAADREAGRARVAEAVQAAFARGQGQLLVVPPDPDREVKRHHEGFRCDGCGRAFPVPIPALFSFNSPLGACAACQGFGRTQELDWDRIIPDRTKSLEELAIAPFATRMGRHILEELVTACAVRGVPVDVPFEALTDEQQAWVFDGDEDGADPELEEELDEGTWYGVRGFFAWLEHRRYKVQARTLIARYRKFLPCTACGATRLSAEARCVTVAGRSLGDVQRDSVDELLAWLEGLALEGDDQATAGRLVETLRTRVDTVARVGLGYVSLDRQVRTLSGGEAQRIQLATALGGRLTSSLYVLDEPSIGLHASDVDRLIAVLESIRDHGNTVVVVEHATEIVAAADHVIDLGPAAGRHGGELIVEGTVEEVRAHERSKTGRALRGELTRGSRRQPREARGELRIVGAHANNLQHVDVAIPLGQLVVVSGVSGAGKSTLIDDVLVGQLLARLDPAAAARRGGAGACAALEGAEHIEEVVVVDQTPASRSPRSNPATISKAFDAIRSLFASTREARALGVGPGWFSFNVAGGRCEVCEGAGELVIDMQFLDDVRVPCEVCGGCRYRREVLQVRVDGLSITDVLALTLAEASERFAGEPKIAGRLEPFVRVGLGYLRLGQPLSTLSGGENQRVRLAQALGGAASARNRTGDAPAGARLFVLDEPTTGLHPTDIEVLLSNLDRLIDAGGSAIVIEHNLDVIRRADFVLDLGPEGGPAGGRIVAAGSPAQVAGCPGSLTGAALRRAGVEPEARP